MEYVSVKMPKDKSRLVKLLKAEAVREGGYDATEAEIIGRSVEYSYQHRDAFIRGRSKGDAKEILRHAGKWRMSDDEAERRIEEMRKWRKSTRPFA